MDFIPDYELAKKESREPIFGTYSSAYIITNEDLRASMNFVPKNCENALVVAASGDHPLFCSLYGAKNVDTFDISYNAKCIMDIKIAALNIMNHSEYTSFIKDLYDISVPLTRIKNMDNILYKLPKTEYDYINALSDYPIFYRRSISLNHAVLPTQFEYNELRKRIKLPYNFILTNICQIGEKLTKSYDFIHLSNIFDYTRSFYYEHVVLSLMERVRPGGRIVTQFFAEGNDQIFDVYMAKIIKNHNNWILNKTIINNNKFEYFKNGIYVLERTR